MADFFFFPYSFFTPEPNQGPGSQRLKAPLEGAMQIVDKVILRNVSRSQEKAPAWRVCVSRVSSYV